MEGLENVARALGFGPSAPLNADLRTRLGIPASVISASMGSGAGSLRVLLVDLPQSAPAKSALNEIAAAVSLRSPHLLWSALAIRADHEITICAWTQGKRQPLVSALVTNRSSPVESDLQALCSLAAVSSGVDLLAHTRWLEILGREAITARFFRTLQDVLAGMSGSLPATVDSRDASDFALLTVSRLLFLSFVEAKGWLNRDFEFLVNRFTDCVSAGGQFHGRILNPLFFGTLNTVMKSRASRARAFGDIPFLNGGMFSRSPLEKRIGKQYFSDDSLGDVFGELLVRYRFTAREEMRGWSETAIDPEILGRSFESLMATRERKVTGAFYTPHRLVEDVTRASLCGALARAGLPDRSATGLLDGEAVSPTDAKLALSVISSLRVLDPACGSGAFLVHVMERLASLRALCGDLRPVSERRRTVVADSIFGVDSNPSAVWLCELRLWLSVVIDSAELDPMRIDPLPNLDRNIRVGDSLEREVSLHDERASSPRYRTLRIRYVRAAGARKLTLARALDRAEREAAKAVLTHRIAIATDKRRDVLATMRSRDLFGIRSEPSRDLRDSLAIARTNVADLRRKLVSLQNGGALPFSFLTHFPDISAAGGFDLVVGNPPWVRLHHIPGDARARLRSRYYVYLNACWRAGAQLARAGAGFGAQVDLAALFIERALTLVKPGGVTALLVPAKLWRSLSGGGVRALLCQRSEVEVLEDYSESRSAFDAAVYPSMLLARRRVDENCGQGHALSAAVHRRDTAMRWTVPARTLPFDDTSGSPWIVVPPEVRAAFNLVRDRGTRFSDSTLGRPILGVKCGLNDAFVVQVVGHDGTVAQIEAGGRIGELRLSHLRPLARGENVRAWSVETGSNHIVWPYDRYGRLLAELPNDVAAWLRPWKRKLQARTDGTRSSSWWSLFRTDGAHPSSHRVVWSDFGKRPRAAVLEAGNAIVPLNSCYVARCGSKAEADALAVILNSPLLAAWLRIIAEPARGGFARFLGWTMALLPLPSPWESCIPALAAAVRGKANTRADRALMLAALSAYRLRECDVEALLLWSFPD